MDTTGISAGLPGQNMERVTGRTTGRRVDVTEVDPADFSETRIQAIRLQHHFSAIPTTVPENVGQKMGRDVAKTTWPKDRLRQGYAGLQVWANAPPCLTRGTTPIKECRLQPKNRPLTRHLDETIPDLYIAAISQRRTR